MTEQELRKIIKEAVAKELQAQGVYNDANGELDESLKGRIGATALAAALGLGSLHAGNNKQDYRDTNTNRTNTEYVQDYQQSKWAHKTTEVLLDIILNQQPLNQQTIDMLKNTEKGDLALKCLARLSDLAHQHYNYYITHQKELKNISCRDYIRRQIGYNQETKQAKDVEVLMYKYRLDDNDYLQPYMLANYIADLTVQTKGGGMTTALLQQNTNKILSMR